MFTSVLTVKIVIAATAATATLVAAGCSNNSSIMSSPTPGMEQGSSSSSAAPAVARSDFNEADVTFLQVIYPHHVQAVDMAKLVPGRSQNEQVLALAANIEKAQQPEMTQVADLLQSFGKPAPTIDAGHVAGMPGMMTERQMNTLKGLSGRDFDRMWLQMMIDHHTSAITMSNTELASGTNPDAKNLAEKIITNQQAESDQMRNMLSQ